MIGIAAAFVLTPIVLERDRAVPDNVHFPPAGAETPSYFAWYECVEASARVGWHGKDSAETISEAALAACREEEAAAIKDPANTLSSTQWKAERDNLKGLALVEVIRLRANDAVSRTK